MVNKIAFSELKEEVSRLIKYAADAGDAEKKIKLYFFPHPAVQVLERGQRFLVMVHMNAGGQNEAFFCERCNWRSPLVVH